MKIVFTSLGETLDSPIDQRFGRARYFILFDTVTRDWSSHSNDQNLQAAQGAGIQAAMSVINLGANCVVTGHCGPKAFATLQAGNIEVYQEAAGNVSEALDAFEKNMLTKAEHPNVEGHFGSA